MYHGRPGSSGRGYTSNRGRSPRSGDYRPRHAGGDGPSLADSSSPNSGVVRDRSSHQMPSRNFKQHYVQKQASGSDQWQWRPLNGGKDASPDSVNLQQEHNSTDDMGNTSDHFSGSIASNTVSSELSSSSVQYDSKNLHSAVERIQIGEPTEEGGGCSDPLPSDNCNRLDAVDQKHIVQVPLESCAKDETSDNFKQHYVQKQASGSDQWQWRPLNGGKDASPDSVNLQQEHNSTDDMGNTSDHFSGSIASNTVSSELSSSSVQYDSKNLHSAVERIQIGEPTEERGGCSDPLPSDNCNRLDAVDQKHIVQVPLESCAKDETSDNFKQHYVQKQASGSDQWQWRPLNGGKDASPASVNLQQEHNATDDMGNTSDHFSGSIASNTVSSELSSSSVQYDSKNLHSAVERIQIGEPTEEGGGCSDPLPSDNCNRLDAVDQKHIDQVPLESCAKDETSSIKLRESNISDCKDSKDNKPSVGLELFDICPQKSGGFKLKPSLLAKNREKRNEKRAMEGNGGIVLRPGMVLLKGGISLRDQVKVVKKCRELGVGLGGFYQPGYREGGKLHLKMMCLGKNWDPETSKYGDVRPFDDAKPPGIPLEFYDLVEKALKDCYAAIGTKNPERLLPWIKPNICIVNFYAQNGSLGLHQDRDESEESLAKGLPVVSFSIGDSAEFQFGDQRDTDQAEKVTLKSGDILIFGGKSRHIFHGVTAIVPNTAPTSLLEETKLLSGRLNLTFRQY